MGETRQYFNVDAFPEASDSTDTGRPKRYAPASGNRTKQPEPSGKVEIGRFTMLPRMLFGSGMAAKLGQSATLLYVALWEHANRNSGNTFKASDSALASDTGLAPRTISGLRQKLLDNGLVEVSRKPGQSSLYTLLPQAFEWMQVDLRPRRKRNPRAYGALTKQASAEGRIPPHAKFATVCSKVC